MDHLSLPQLNPFPLPKQLEALPPQLLEAFTQLYELVRGYVQQLPSYEEKKREIVNTVGTLIDHINSITQSLESYSATRTVIEGQIHQLQKLYQEFVNLETIQYQLLSSNFNQDLLRRKFHKLVDASHTESLRLCQPSDNIEQSLRKFKEARVTYHLRKEKLNRWDEERVSGFM